MPRIRRRIAPAQVRRPGQEQQPRLRELPVQTGIVAFPRSETIQAVARTVPEDRLLVETDSPFLAPPPHRGRRNEPAFVVEVARKVAGLRGDTLEAVGAASGRNFERLFGRR